MNDLGIGCSIKTEIAKKFLELKDKEANDQNLQNANVKDETDVADLLGMKRQRVMEEEDSSNNSGGLSSEAHLKSQSNNSNEPLDWKKVVLDGISTICSNLPAVLVTKLEGDFILKILSSCSEEISKLTQSEASSSMNEVVSGVYFATIKHFFVYIGLIERKMNSLQEEVNLLRGEMNHQQYTIQSLESEIKVIHEYNGRKSCCEDDAGSKHNRREDLQVGEQTLTQSSEEFLHD